MSQENSPRETPQEAIGRGFRLGLVLVLIFGFSAVVSYVLLGILGMEDVGQLLVALLIGPFIGSGLFWVWWSGQRHS